MSPEDRTQFRDESILHIKLRHRNVVRCFAVWDDEPPIKMILEYSEIGMVGGDLATHTHTPSHTPLCTPSYNPSCTPLHTP